MRSRPVSVSGLQSSVSSLDDSTPDLGASTSSLVIVSSASLIQQAQVQDECERDFSMVSAAIDKPGTDPASAEILKRIYVLLSFGVLCNKDNKLEANVLPLASLICHGARVLLQVPTDIGEPLMEWIFNGKSQTYFRYAASHDIKAADAKTADAKKLTEVKSGLFNAALNTAQFALSSAVSYIPFVGWKLQELSSTSTKHYGVNLALGGAGEQHFYSEKIIQNDGSNGHLYLCHTQTKHAHGLLIGIEQSQPNKDNQFGGSHNFLATHHNVTATGGSDFAKKGTIYDKLGPDKYHDGLFCHLTPEQFEKAKTRYQQFQTDWLLVSKINDEQISRAPLKADNTAKTSVSVPVSLPLKPGDIARTPIRPDEKNGEETTVSIAALDSKAVMEEKTFSVATISNSTVSVASAAISSAPSFNPKKPLERIRVALDSPDHPMYTDPAALKPSGIIISDKPKSFSGDVKANLAPKSIDINDESAAIKFANEKIKITLQAAAFRKIYTALRDGQSGIFKSNFLKNKNAVTDKELIKQITERCLQHPDSRTNKAWELAQLHYSNCSPSNTVLFTAIYKWAFEKSGKVFKKSNLTHTRFFSSNSFNKQVNTLSKGQIDQGIAKDSDSRTARIARSLK